MEGRGGLSTVGVRRRTTSRIRRVHLAPGSMPSGFVVRGATERNKDRPPLLLLHLDLAAPPFRLTTADVSRMRCQQELSRLVQQHATPPLNPDDQVYLPLLSPTKPSSNVLSYHPSTVSSLRVPIKNGRFRLRGGKPRFFNTHTCSTL